MIDEFASCQGSLRLAMKVLIVTATSVKMVLVRYLDIESSVCSPDALADDNLVVRDQRAEVEMTRTVPTTWTSMHSTRHARRASTIGTAVEGQWSTRCVTRTLFSDMCAHAGDPAAASFARPSALTADLSSQILLGAESSHQELSGAVFVFS